MSSINKFSTDNIRQQFLDFFKEKGHQIVASAPIVVKNDPTLMFTNAGMNQFKDIFLGDQRPSHKRVANTQKCLRVSGKHNDLEEVGFDTYHHTMFEMLGNWSFGDYFKEDAIQWAWELLIDVYGIDADRLYVTVFKSDGKDGIKDDDNAKLIWEKIIDKDKVLPFGKKDNFWEMGDTGPCGRCSEIHIDLRSDSERKKKNGAELVNTGDAQVIELWNLVFIEFNQLSDGTLEPLKDKHVDTGMGLERLAMILQNKTSNYDIDIFQSIIKSIKGSSNITDDKNEKADIATKVVADHLRAVAFAIADGQLPHREGAGYVIRRILRRAIRYGYSNLGHKEPFIESLVPVLNKQMGGTFPELVAQEDLIRKVIHEEEESFLRTLDKGTEIFNNHIAGLKSKKIEGEFAFELFDTFGFPYDLTELMARESNLTVDRKGFEKEMSKQKDRSRKAGSVATSDWEVLLEDDIEEFVGYDQLETDVKITKYREVTIKNESHFQLVFNFTPFYAESGGQVGDTGTLEADGKTIEILDTKKENELIVHLTKEFPDDPKKVFHVQVDTDKRRLTANNHSATHLLHHALREILGNHVQQKGSFLNSEYLRFDFTHFAKVNDEEITKIEARVNQLIRENDPLKEKRAIPMADAKKLGAIALFGEKYGDMVRVIQFGDSFELCGGTHVNATGQIGMMKITSEGSVAAGIRRIEAITADEAEEYINTKLGELAAMTQMLKVNKEPVKRLEEILKDHVANQKQASKDKSAGSKQIKEDMLKKVEEVNGIHILLEELEDGSEEVIKDISFEIKKEVKDLFMVVGSEIDGKALLSIIISETLVKEKGLHAGDIIKDLAKEIKGGGGGQPFYATAGGKDPKGIPKALEKARTLIENV